MDEELKIIITAECDKVKQEVSKASGELDKFEKKGSNAGKNFGKAMEAAGKATKAAMKVVASAIAAGVTALVALSESTAEYRESQAKLVTAFESVGSSAEQAKDTYNDLYRVLGDGDVAVEAANHLAKLTTEEQSLSEWTKICEGVYGTFGDSLPIEGLTEAANETAKTGQLTGVLADALNWAGVSEDKFNESLSACNSEAEREQLIRETLNGLYSEAAEAYEKNAADLLAANEAQAALTEGLAQLGAVAQPIVTLFKKGLADALKSILPGLKKVGDGIRDMLNGLDGGPAKMKKGIEEMVKALTEKATQLLPTILKVGIDIVVALLEGVADSLPDVVDTLVELIPTVVDAITNLLPELIAIGIEMIAALLEGLADTIPDVIQAIVDMIPEIVNAVVEGFPLLLAGAIELFMAIVQAIPDFLPDLIDALPEIINSIVDVILDSIPQLMRASVQLFMGLVKAIPEIIPALIRSLGEIVSTITTNLIERLKSLMHFDWSLPKLKLPHLSISGKFSINPPSVPHFSISWYKNGGVFDMPTLFNYGGGIGGLGEDGAEAIVPLEKNTEWLDRIATMLTQKMGGSGPIVLQVDGRTLAEVSIDSINELTRQRGSLALNLI